MQNRHWFLKVSLTTDNNGNRKVSTLKLSSECLRILSLLIDCVRLKIVGSFCFVFFVGGSFFGQCYVKDLFFIPWVHIHFFSRSEKICMYQKKNYQIRILVSSLLSKPKHYYQYSKAEALLLLIYNRNIITSNLKPRHYYQYSKAEALLLLI